MEQRIKNKNRSKMDEQNISIGSGSSHDEFFRYKMPRMETKIEGQGNGIKTNVVNMGKIAVALDCPPPAHITKYFGYELGAQSKFDEKTNGLLVNGDHDTDKLVGLLENFIKKYVLCYVCGNPETAILITNTQMMQLKCVACGCNSDVNMRDKLTKFILKNPPEQNSQKAMRRAEKERLQEGETADEELKKMKKEGKKTGSTSISNEDHHSSPPNGSQADENDEDDDVQWHTDTSLEAAHQRIQEQLSAVTAEMVMLSTTEPGKEKPKPAKKVVGSPAASNGGTPEEKSKAKAAENGTTVACSYEKLVEKIKMNLKGSTVSQVQCFLGSLDGSPQPQEIMSALLDALFGGVVKGFSKEVTKKKNYLGAVTEEEGSQILLLRAIDSFCRKSSPEVVKEVVLVLKTLYDANVLEEEYIVRWSQEGLSGGEKNSQNWKNVKPFIEWLQNAESESESESE